MAATTSNTLGAGGSNSYLLQEYLVKRVGLEAAQIMNIPDSVWVEYLMGENTLVAHFRFENTLTASSQTEGNTLSVSTWNPSGTTMTAALDGLAVQVTKLLDTIAPDVLARVARQCGTAMGRAIDTSLAALFPSLTAGTVTGSGSSNVLVVADVVKANANLDANHADEISGYQGRFHPKQFQDLYTDIISKNFGIAKVTLDAEGKTVINIGETIIYKNTLLSKTNSSNYWAGGVYCNEALGLAIAQQPDVTVMPIPGQATYSVDATVAFATGTVRPTLGCLVQSAV